MAHYAYIDENNLVTAVIVGPDEGTEPEGFASWEDYFSAKGKGVALRTSYNTFAGNHSEGSEPFRGNFAGIGFSYDPELDVFLPPKPFESWVMSDNYQWQAPVSYPADGEDYVWDEDSQSWIVEEQP